MHGMGDHAMLGHLLAKYDKWTRPGSFLHNSTSTFDTGKYKVDMLKNLVVKKRYPCHQNRHCSPGAPTIVNVSIYIRDFSLDDAKMVRPNSC